MQVYRKSYHRPALRPKGCRARKRQRGRQAGGPRLQPRVGPELKPLLQRIGVPAAHPFVPDPFQRRALAALEGSDVLVTAPTGSGKTWIALKAMEKLLAAGGRSWYASPLKALSNSKYVEFSQYFGAHRVGILTGDRKENPQAPLIIGTTEILRNQLYDAMHQGKDLPVELVILDEAHYLGDPDRGVVWEEVIIYLSSRIRLLLLSATISNAGEIAGWLQWVRHQPCEVVAARHRPVPLHLLFMFPGGKVTPLGRGRKMAAGVRRFLERRPRSGLTPRRGVANFSEIIAALRQLNLLPAIFFLKSRADCNLAVQAAIPRSHYQESPEEWRRFHRRLGELLEAQPYLRNSRQLEAVRQGRVAAHHGGQLPQWKALVETLMKEGALEAIFSTSTVAAGVNFPARTVVLSQSDRFNGRKFIPLSAMDLLQMTGRAGRRGMDRVGFVMVLPGPYQDPGLIFRLMRSSPEPISSQIQISFSMVLNLLLSHRPPEIKELLSRSFATYQDLELHLALEGSVGSERRTGTRAAERHRPDKTTSRLWYEFNHHFNFLRQEGYVDAGGRLSEDGRWASQLRLDQPLLIAECIRRNVLPQEDPAVLAGLLAPFVSDREQGRHAAREPLPHHPSSLEQVFAGMVAALDPLCRRLRREGFWVSPFPFWPAAAIHDWASGRDWEEVLLISGLDEGDLAMLVYRTADSLRQLRGLSHSHPRLAACAGRAIRDLLRQPVVVPT